MTLSHDDPGAFLRGQFTVSGAGSGRTVLVCGDPGSGKTAVLRAFTEHAERSGALVLSGIGTPDEQPLRAGVLEQLICAAGMPAETRGRVSSLLSSLDSDDIQHIHEVGAVLLETCREHAVVIAVDDVHHADDWSVRLLCHLHRRIGPTRLLTVLTRSTLAQATLSPQADLVALDSERMRLDPAAAAAGPSAPIDALHAATHRWGARLSEVSRAIAILAEQADGESVTRFVGGPTRVVEDMISVLDRAGLLSHDGRFRQPEVAAAALTGLPVDELVRLHERAAAVTYRQGWGAPVVARQLLAGGRVEPGWPVTVLREAAERSVAADEIDFATRCLELASTAAVDDPERIEIQAELARTAWRSDPQVTSRRLAPLSETVGPRSGAHTLALVRDSLWNGDRGTLAAALGAGLTALPMADPQTRAQMRLACLWHFGPNNYVPGDAAEPTDSPWQRVTEALADGWLNGVGERAATSAELVLRSCRLDDLSLEALAIALCVLPIREQAENWCTQLLSEAEARGAVTWQALLRAVHALLQLRGGAPAAAAEEAQAALRMLSTESWGAAIGFPLAVRILAHTAAGDHDAAADALRIPVPDAMFGTLNGLRYLSARGRHRLARNQVLAAVNDFQRCQRDADEHWGGDQTGLASLVPWRHDLADAMELAGFDRDAEPAKQPGRRWAVRLPGSASRALEHGTAATARATRRTHQEPPDGPPLLAHQLSEAELRVAELAAVGLSNRKISEDLYVTVSTVEQHLTRVYKKLGVSGRDGLAARLGPATG